MQIGAMLLPALAFASYLAAVFVATLVRFGRRRLYAVAVPEPLKLPVRRWMRWLAGTGLAAIVGFLCYLNFLMFTGASAVGPVVVGRPLPWLALQALSVAAAFSTLALAVSWWSCRGAVRGAERGVAERAWGIVMLTGGVVFVAWATYWGLLVL